MQNIAGETRDALVEACDITVYAGKGKEAIEIVKNASFKAKNGELTGICGPNGAGKSTLMKVLSGVYPDGTYTGEIHFGGKMQSFKNTGDSEKTGIAIIYQELALVPEMTVFENVFLGHEISKGLTINENETIQRTLDV
ncbi:ATP-binding cassette domain-containing protein, partial [Candidatus Nomurabacteria bacterium]|nr:ATP-binding cassette domain-containing protein [Candidatus Nomurabacteria bacterium]